MSDLTVHEDFLKDTSELQPVPVQGINTVAERIALVEIEQRSVGQEDTLTSPPTPPALPQLIESVSVTVSETVPVSENQKKKETSNKFPNVNCTFNGPLLQDSAIDAFVAKSCARSPSSSIQTAKLYKGLQPSLERIENKNISNSNSFITASVKEEISKLAKTKCVLLCQEPPQIPSVVTKRQDIRIQRLLGTYPGKGKTPHLSKSNGQVVQHAKSTMLGAADSRRQRVLCMTKSERTASP